MDSDAEKVRANIKRIYSRRKAAVRALCLQYAGLALQNFRAKQPHGSGIKGKYWHNRTSTAEASVFSGIITEKDIVGFFLAHAVEYGVYLELANDRKHQALVPTVGKLYARFKRDLEAIFDAA